VGGFGGGAASGGDAGLGGVASAVQFGASKSSSCTSDAECSAFGHRFYEHNATPVCRAVSEKAYWGGDTVQVVATKACVAFVPMTAVFRGGGPKIKELASIPIRSPFKPTPFRVVTAGGGQCDDAIVLGKDGVPYLRIGHEWWPRDAWGDCIGPCDLWFDGCQKCEPFECGRLVCEAAIAPAQCADNGIVYSSRMTAGAASDPTRRIMFETSSASGRCPRPLRRCAGMKHCLRSDLG
jgi:hypothetical protein